MRTEFHADLDRLTAEVAEMCAIACDLIQCATTALVETDVHLAEKVLLDLHGLDRLRDRATDRAFALLALQAPVARDLRVVVSSIQIAAAADRMGGLANNVAKVVRRHHPEPAVPTSALSHFTAMAQVAVELARRVQAAVATCDAAQARRILADDDMMNDLHRQLFVLVLDSRWPHGAAAAADVALLGRFYERFADQVVDIARRVVFQSSGRIGAVGSGSDLVASDH
ncbi:phosphate signaling complex protein PhoU [Mycobacterium sp. URHB0021]|jgi:phosphate transport system protein